MKAQSSIWPHRLFRLDPWRFLVKIQHSRILDFVAYVAPARMITILFTSARVAPGCLQVPVFGWTDPDIGPCRWNCQRLDPRQCCRIADRLAVGSDITKMFRFPLQCNARMIGADVSQADHLDARGGFDITRCTGVRLAIFIRGGIILPK